MTAAFFVQLRREMGAIFASPMAYIIFFFFTLIAGVVFYQNLQYLEYGTRYSVVQMFFLGVWFWMCLLIMIPLVTMRMFSEEYRSGTIEILLTAPVSDWDVVVSKFLGALVFYLTLWAPTLVYLILFQWVTDGAMPVKWSSLLLCYSLVLLLGAFFIALGLFASSLTRNQPLAAFMSFASLLLFFFIGLLSFNMNDSKFSSMVEYIASYRHMQTFLDGIFDTRPLVFYLSATLLFLALTQRVIAIKKLKA
ncbi:MAG: ABC transporter permease [Candidatus Methylacidiphilales bacterium]